MTAREIATLLAYIIAALFVVAIILMILALQQLRRGRKGPYWRLRRRASQRGGILFLASLGLFVIAGALLFYSGLAVVAFRDLDSLFRRSSGGLIGVVVPTETPTLNLTWTSTPTLTPTVTASPSPTDTPSSTPTPTLTPSLSPTLTTTATESPTPSPSPTSTTTPTVDSVVQLTPPAVARTARPGAVIEITAADSQLAADNGPAQPQPQTSFPAGIARIYFFIRYRGMDDGVGWARVLYRDGQPIQGQAYLWSQGQQGQSFFFFGNEDGYPAGSYEVRLYLGEREVSRYQFHIQT